jgi:hypothetical protein
MPKGKGYAKAKPSMKKKTMPRKKAVRKTIKGKSRPSNMKNLA